MTTLIMLAAGLLSVPLPDRSHAERLQRAYPMEAIRGEKSSASLIRVVLAPSGKVDRCETLSIVGDEELGKHPCSVYVRFEFDPPTGADGQPAFAMYETVVRYELWGTRGAARVASFAQSPLLSLTVETLPPNAGTVLDLEVLAQVTPTGDVTACEGTKDAPANYAAAACRSLEADGWSALQDGGGNAVPYVALLKVRFTTGSVG